MKPFNYLSPTTVEEAIAFHGRHSQTAKYIGGGTDVIVKIKDGWLEPDYLISLKNVGAPMAPLGMVENDTRRGAGPLYLVQCRAGHVEQRPGVGDERAATPLRHGARCSAAEQAVSASEATSPAIPARIGITLRRFILHSSLSSQRSSSAAIADSRHHL